MSHVTYCHVVYLFTVHYSELNRHLVWRNRCWLFVNCQASTDLWPPSLIGCRTRRWCLDVWLFLSHHDLIILSLHVFGHIPGVTKATCLMRWLTERHAQEVALCETEIFKHTHNQLPHHVAPVCGSYIISDGQVGIWSQHAEPQCCGSAVPTRHSCIGHKNKPPQFECQKKRPNRSLMCSSRLFIKLLW